jgi:hypothetical protein
MYECGLDSPGFGERPLRMSREHCNEFRGYIKDVEFLDYVSDY